jgi:hypothetical protein
MSNLIARNASSRREDRVFYEHGRRKTPPETPPQRCTEYRPLVQGASGIREESPEQAGIPARAFRHGRRFIGIFSRETSADPVGSATESDGAGQ